MRSDLLACRPGVLRSQRWRVPGRWPRGGWHWCWAVPTAAQSPTQAHCPGCPSAACCGEACRTRQGSMSWYEVLRAGGHHEASGGPEGTMRRSGEAGTMLLWSYWRTGGHNDALELPKDKWAQCCSGATRGQVSTMMPRSNGLQQGLQGITLGWVVLADTCVTQPTSSKLPAAG